VADRSDVFSDKLIGASGVQIIVAPLPMFEASELPYTLVATTLAKTKSPELKKYGGYVRTD
jgi:hypothetical protein